MNKIRKVQRGRFRNDDAANDRELGQLGLNFWRNGKPGNLSKVFFDDRKISREALLNVLKGIGEIFWLPANYGLQ